MLGQGAAVAGSAGRFATGANGTVSFLFRTPASLTPSDWLRSLFSQGVFGSSSQFEVALVGSTLRLGTRQGTGQPTVNLATLLPDTWYYFAMHWDTALPVNNLTWYLGEAGDTALQSGQRTITSAGAAEAPVLISGRATSNVFLGHFQNIAVYERTLTGDAIRSQFDAIRGERPAQLAAELEEAGAPFDFGAVYLADPAADTEVSSVMV